MSIQSVMSKINKKYGKEIIQVGLETKKGWFPTGIVNVDWALGGGFAEGAMIELYGPPSSGKSTLALKAMSLAQKVGKVCCYIDAEDAYDSKWAQQNGIDISQLIVVNKEQLIEIAKENGDKGINAELVLQMMIDLIDTKGIDFLVLDSIACLSPRDEIQKDMSEEAKMAGVAKLMTRALRVLNVKNGKKTTIVFINQLRDNIGGYGMAAVTPGGRAVKFFSSQRVNIKRKKNVSKSDEVIGFDVAVTIEKNKVAAPYKTVEYTMMNDASVDRFIVYWNLAKNLGTFGDGVEVTGRTYTYKGEVVAKSQAEFEEWLKSKPEVFELLEKSLINFASNSIEKPKEVQEELKTEEEVVKEIIEETSLGEATTNSVNEQLEDALQLEEPKKKKKKNGKEKTE